MSATARRRITSILLWLVIAVIWVAFYPAFHLSRREAGLALLSLFFFLGLQHFRDEEAAIRKAAEHGFPIPQVTLKSCWRSWRKPLFLFLGIICIAVFVVGRIRTG